MIKKGILIILFLVLISCSKNDENINEQNLFPAYQITETVSFNDVSVDVVIDKPIGNEFDVLMVFHGTVGYDSLILDAAYTTLNAFKNLLVDKNMLIISVVYPEENLLFGDNLQQCEAALLWLKNNAASELDISINKIFLAGHSQGGYLVTRLNTMHQTNGVIANAPGPLNLVYRCELEESGQIGSGQTCMLLNQFYGTTTENPDAYFQRSLLNFTNGL
jgi:poly(3-hydroxybutyrate) depolymerase